MCVVGLKWKETNFNPPHPPKNASFALHEASLERNFCLTNWLIVRNQAFMNIIRDIFRWCE
jgi:hypothetical protein